MAFTLPDFNLVCDVYAMPGGTWSTRALRTAGVACNLALGRRVQQMTVDFPDSILGAAAPSLLLPPLTDVRDYACGGTADMVEVPSGSGRWYQVALVDDIGKGFANEHRIAWIYKAAQAYSATRYSGLVWPSPIP